MSKNVLNDLGINYTEKNVDTNEKFMDEAKVTGYKSMPIILKDGQVIASGFIPDVLNQLGECEREICRLVQEPFSKGIYPHKGRNNRRN